MSISNTTYIAFGNGDGVTTTFSFPFRIFLTTDLVVSLINISTQAITPQVLGTNYSVAILPSYEEGGSVTFVVAPPVGYQWYVQRVEPFTQTLSVPTEGAIPAQALNNALDQLTMLCIQVNGAVINQVNASLAFTGNLPILIPSPIANEILAWDPTGKFLINIPNSGPTGPRGPTGPAGPLSSVTSANGDISVANSTTAPVLTLNSGTGASQIVKLTAASKLPAVDGSLLTGIVATVNANLSGNQLGAWLPYSSGSTPWTYNTVYQAATDILVTFWGYESSTQINFTVVTDSNPSPSTVRINLGETPTGLVESCTFMVRKDDYWELSESVGATLTSFAIYVFL